MGERRLALTIPRFGAIVLNEFEQGSSRWTTFADPEGNEFDVIATTT
jgi:predicted enzyme related to lactoylglutathione lyase